MEKLKVAFIGHGLRGKSMLSIVLKMKDIEVVAVCDAYPDRTEEMVNKVVESGGKAPYAGKDHRDIIANCTLDAAVVCTSWSTHIPISIDFMDAGIPVGFEVGGCSSIEVCWDLIRAYKRTGVHAMMLENCCYCRDEMMILNMVKKGIFGEIVHCEGGYRHDLRSEIVRGVERRHYRLAEYTNKNCDNYPTHALGPIAKLLNINRGNRFTSLSSVASKSVGIRDYLKITDVANKDLYNVDFKQADVVTTTITCAQGETITLTLDTTLPRYYSRGFRVCATRAMFDADCKAIFLPGEYDDKDIAAGPDIWNSIEKYRDEYEHPLWKEYINVGVADGHGGMDHLVLRAFFESVKSGTRPPIDTYDSVAWMIITPLSEVSILKGGAPVEIPDFTDGKWIEKNDGQECKYSLDKICTDEATPIYPE